MPVNSVCRTFIPKLSPFMDGELRSAERVQVEEHLASCSECSGRAADLRAESALIRVGMELLADEADLRDFSKGVIERIAQQRIPLLERWKVSIGELFTYRRGWMISLAGAAAAIVALAPLLLRGGAPEGYASERMTVQAVSTDPAAHVAPVVMSDGRGDAIVWLVSHKHVLEGRAAPTQDVGSEELDLEAQPGQPKTKLNQERPRGGEL